MYRNNVILINNSFLIIFTEPSTSNFEFQRDVFSERKTPAKNLLNHSGSGSDSGSSLSQFYTSPEIAKRSDRESKTHKSNVIETPKSISRMQSPDARTISFTLPPFEDKRHRQLPSLASPFDDNSSFHFDTTQNRNRVYHRIAKSSLPGMQRNLFDQDSEFSDHNRRFDEPDRNRQFDEPELTESPRATLNHFKVPFSPPVAHPKTLKRVVAESFESFETRNSHRTRTRTRTRVTRQAISHPGESPFAEQIIIEKVKKPF